MSEPQPMDTAPAGDGWMLGLVDQDGAPGARRQMAARYGLAVIEDSVPPVRLALSNSGIPKVRRLSPPDGSEAA